jgi:WD40 repeat protein
MLTVACVLTSTCGFSSPAELRLGKLFGSHMNDVVIKVAELPARSRQWVPLGLAFSPDGDQIAVGADEGVAILDWQQAHLDRTLELPKGLNIGLTTNPLRYSPDGTFLAICGEGARGDVVRIWNASNWSIAKDITNFEGWGCTALGFSTDGKTIFNLMNSSGGKGEEFIVYEVGTWQKLWGLTFSHLSPVSLAVSPDGREVAVGGQLLIAPSPAEVPDPVKRGQESYFEPHIYLLDLRSRDVVKDIKTAAMGPLAWSSDGSRIGVAGQQNVEMFDARSGQRLLHAELSRSAHMNLLFTPDGRYFIESDMNGRGTGLGIHIWDIGRQKLLQAIPGNVDGIAVSKHGRYLAVGLDGRTTIWQFNNPF